MTRQKFIRLMNNAIAKCSYIGNGGFTCNIISLLESTDCHNPSKIRKSYSYLFEFGYYTAESRLSYDIKHLKNVRLNCLELFKTIMLESKGYEEL